MNKMRRQYKARLNWQLRKYIARKRALAYAQAACRAAMAYAHMQVVRSSVSIPAPVKAGVIAKTVLDGHAQIIELLKTIPNVRVRV